MLALIVGLLYLVAGHAVRSQDATGSRFVCNAIPPGAEPGCGYGPTGNRVQSSSPVEDELRNTIIQLRETILQQKETIVSQQGTIKELNSKLARCEAAADESSQGKSRGQGSRRKEYGKNTMGDLPRDPGETIDQLGKTMQSLKGRLENLEVRWHKRAVYISENHFCLLFLPLPADITRCTIASLSGFPLVSYNNAFKSPEDFKVSLPLRTNYLYGRIKKSLPEMYAFTVCMWLKSSASPGIGTPFSYGVPGQANEIVLIEWGNNPIELLVNDKVAQLPLSVSDGRWHHICITWTTRDGFWEAYQDGERLGTGDNLAPWHPIKPGGVIILGQEQDIVGGRFDATQAFVGELSQFNMWDRVLRPVDIMGLANCSAYMPGNVVPWIDANVEVFGGATKAALEICEDRAFDS
uniref:Neuronal pentraxin 2a n=1 Tax=Amphilophus citrinellus TaxID=61819 RepID=A0A3Q0RF80_AMPCI